MLRKRFRVNNYRILSMWQYTQRYFIKLVKNWSAIDILT
jgi:hypothetical protein